MTYPKQITLQNDELKDLIEKKADLVNEGRAKSEEIEKLEKEMDAIDKELQEEEKKVDLKEFFKKEKAITKRMEKCIADINAVKEAIYAKIKAETPQEIRDRYEETKKQKEDKEEERNKIALKAQKFTDLIVPMTRELMKPYLTEEGDDYDSVGIKDGQVVSTIFNHFDDFRKDFLARKK